MIQRLLATLCLVALPCLSSAATFGDCTGAPQEAIGEVPPSVSDWAALACTPDGQLLTAPPGLSWKFVTTLGAFVLPAGFGQSAAQPGPAYFRDIQVQDIPLDHALARHAAAMLNDGLAPIDVPWRTAQVVSLTNTRAQGIRVFVFENETMRWGMLCDWSGEQCSTRHRFMVLDVRDATPAP
ncbi:hypothetical protein [Marilutibacter spongiae]|uniref:Lipoprotein n=1 Tax=Marilutibacter spongiae TaxID=2025720 RepID=A0A7W3TPD0_9GAMM|nr:hypothetical protein [Lysobacter spongiae]MBB1062036.1 hypothetical protein [Lysobacter spongiae]